MSEWQPINTAPMNVRILVAFHGHGVNQVAICSRIARTGNWGDWDYINSHDGEPKYWMPLPAPPNDIAGPDCGCDGCTEQYHPEELMFADNFAEGVKVENPHQWHSEQPSDPCEHDWVEATITLEFENGTKQDVPGYRCTKCAHGKLLRSQIVSYKCGCTVSYTGGTPDATCPDHNAIPT